jgi:hypothetical protein
MDEQQMYWYAITPLDVLLFREAKPFRKQKKRKEKKII